MDRIEPDIDFSPGECPEGYKKVLRRIGSSLWMFDEDDCRGCVRVCPASESLWLKYRMFASPRLASPYTYHFSEYLLLLSTNVLTLTLRRWCFFLQLLRSLKIMSQAAGSVSWHGHLVLGPDMVS